MIHALILVAGYFIPAIFGASLSVSLVSGVVAGLAIMFFSVRWPKPKPPYIAPPSRPGRATARGQAALAAVMVIVGLGIGLFLWFNPLPPRLQTMWLYGFYLAGGCFGSAAGILLTGPASREAHNRWLDSMTPKPSLDSDL